MAGTASAMPNASSTTIAIVRVAPSPSPTPSTTSASTAIVTTNVIVSPVTIPSGRRRPPVALADSRAGSTGSTHGVIAVPAPARNANRINRSIPSLWRMRARALRRITDADQYAPRAMSERGGIDGISNFLGFRWTAADTLHVTIEEKHINGARFVVRRGDLRDGRLLHGLDPVEGDDQGGGHRDGEHLDQLHPDGDERRGDLQDRVLDRRNRRLAVLRSEVTSDDGRLLATAIGSYTIFPRKGR